MKVGLEGGGAQAVRPPLENDSNLVQIFCISQQIIPQPNDTSTLLPICNLELITISYLNVTSASFLLIDKTIPNISISKSKYYSRK